MLTTFNCINKDNELITLHQNPAEGNADEFIAQRINSDEIKQILTYFDKNKEQWHIELLKKPTKEAIHISEEKALPRDLLVYHNEHSEVCCLIQLEKYIQGKEKIESNELLIGEGGCRSVEYVFDLHTKDIYAQTVNSSARENELSILKKTNTPYINPLTCYARYGGKTITVSPYQKHGVLKNDNLMRSLSDEQKQRILLQIYMGIFHIHQAGNCHNDLKLLNLLIKNSLDALIIDLDGISKENATSGYIYSHGYEAPEVHLELYFSPKGSLASSIVQDYKTRNVKLSTPYSFNFNHKTNDIFSLGVITYEIANNLKYPSLELVKKLSDTKPENNILGYLSFNMLQPNPEDRPSIEVVISHLMAIIGNHSLKKNSKKILTLDEAATSDDSYLEVSRELFAHGSDIFENMPLELQLMVMHKMRNIYPDIIKTRLYQNLMERKDSLSKRYTAESIVKIIKKCILVESKDNNRFDTINKIELRQATNFLKSLPFSRQQEIILDVIRQTKSILTNENLVDTYYKRKNVFAALLNFIMNFPHKLNFNFIQFLNKLESEEKNIGERINFFVMLRKNYSLFDFANLLIAQAQAYKSKLFKEEPHELHQLIFQFFKDHCSDLRSIYQWRELLCIAINYGALNYKQLSRSEKKWYIELLTNNYHVYAQNSKHSALKEQDIINTLISENETLSISCALYKTMPPHFKKEWINAYRNKSKLCEFINGLFVSNPETAISLFIETRHHYSNQEKAHWMQVAFEHMAPAAVIDHLTNAHCDLRSFKNALQYLTPANGSNLLRVILQKEPAIHNEYLSALTDMTIEKNIQVFSRTDSLLSLDQFKTWANILLEKAEPSGDKELKNISAEVKATAWTTEHKKIFKVITLLDDQKQFNATQRLSNLEKLFNSLQDHHNHLYALKNARLDAIGTFFGSGEKISTRRQVQLKVIRIAAFAALKDVVNTCGSKENKEKILNEYLSKPLFSFHRERNIFNGLMDTTHQKLIKSEIRLLR